MKFKMKIKLTSVYLFQASQLLHFATCSSSHLHTTMKVRFVICAACSFAWVINWLFLFLISFGASLFKQCFVSDFRTVFMRMLEWNAKKVWVLLSFFFLRTNIEQNDLIFPVAHDGRMGSLCIFPSIGGISFGISSTE